MKAYEPPGTLAQLYQRGLWAMDKSTICHSRTMESVMWQAQKEMRKEFRKNTRANKCH